MTILIGVALNILILAIGFVYLHSKFERRTRPEALLQEVTREVNSIIVELNQTTDRNIGLIEERIENLKGLLEKVDKRLALMRREWEQYDSTTQVYSNLKQAAAGGRITPFAQGQGEDSAQRREAPSQGAEQQPQKRGLRPAAGGSSAAKTAQQNRDEIRKQVIALHRKGIAPNIIANRVGFTLGEVELIIALHDKKA